MGTSQKSDGIDIAISLAPEDLHRFLARRRVRSLPGRTSCGGVEDLAQLATTVPAHVSAAPPIDQTALHAAFDRLRAYQPLSECRHGARRPFGPIATAGCSSALRSAPIENWQKVFA